MKHLSAEKQATAIAFENAMLGGLPTLLKYYEPYVQMLAQKSHEASRATLNKEDIAQELRITLTRCWRHQEARSNLLNFDLLAKRAMSNVISTMIGREFSARRGKFHLVFLSELSVPGDEESSNSAAIDYHQYRMGQESHDPDRYQELVEHISSRLPTPSHQKIFSHIAETQEFQYLIPQVLTNKQRMALAKRLQQPEPQVTQCLTEIQFIVLSLKNELQ